ncbi:hypothetical protein RhiJN_05839 [Ceratobasidium sp. AG-Ba]|nr:hypothetical protein RhiJN_05839 [Ceratobasidium sp. AG-Ba]
MKRQTEKMLNAKSTREYKKLGTKYGISGPTILDCIPLLQRPTSYLHEFLHLFLLNHLKNLVALWSGNDATVPDDGCKNYCISSADWEAIGRESEAATASIPSYFMRPLGNIKTQPWLYCGESWVFWLLYIGLIVLRNRLASKYYKHFMELVSIVKCLIQFENSTEQIEQLHEEIAGYVERYEEYYYQYNYNCISVCKLTLHALLHVADDVLICGPVWVTWSYLTERYCREIIACTQQQVVPFATVARFVLQLAQLSAVAMRFPEVRKALLFGKSDAPVNVSRMERVYRDYPDTILRVPCLAGFVMQPGVCRRVAAFLRTNICCARSHHKWMQFLPERCKRWGKLRINDGGDCIRTTCVQNPLSAYGKRDNLFIRYVFEYNKNARNNGPVEMLEQTGYSHLDFILAITLPADPHFDIESPQLHILAYITQAKGAIGDASTRLISYTKMGRSFVLDITAVQVDTILYIDILVTAAMQYLAEYKLGGGTHLLDKSIACAQRALEPGKGLQLPLVKPLLALGNALIVKATPIRLRPNAGEAMADLWAMAAKGQTATSKGGRAVRRGVGAMRRKGFSKGALSLKGLGQEATGWKPSG